jgi:hypothetical protein
VDSGELFLEMFQNGQTDSVTAVFNQERERVNCGSIGEKRCH